jgi:hypothetical protein
MMSPGERMLAIATPVVAMAAVGAGLGLGSSGAVRAAVVFGARAAQAKTGLSWQVLVEQEEHGLREPVADVPVEVEARAGARTATWSGRTNPDGVAESIVGLPVDDGVELEVRSSGVVLASGLAPPPPARRETQESPWSRFARREGPVVLDVAVVGARVAPGFGADVWVRAQDAVSHQPVPGATIEAQEDPSLASVTRGARTDSRGWCHLVVTPVGLAIGLELEARTPDGRKGTWIGGLFASPGAAAITTRARWSPDEPVEIDVSAPPTRSAVYVEIDDASGRAWATWSALAPSQGFPPRAGIRAPGLPAGLYWAVAASDATGASALGSGTSARPFFVAASDDAALALGGDPEACAPARDLREMDRALSTCLALAVPRPVERWKALDGFDAQRARSARRRSHGLALALGAVGLAVLLEAALILRSAASARIDLGTARPAERQRWSVAVAVLAGLLGFALLAAFLARLA